MNALAEQISDFIRRDNVSESDEQFNTLACALFAYHYEHNEPYRRLCESYGQTPDGISHWREIQAVPAAAFKQFSLTCAPLDQIQAVFHSSGTTGEQTSSHYLDADALALYEVSLRTGFDRVFSVTRPRRIWALMPLPSAAPNSSLSHMLGTLKAERFFWQEDPLLAQELRNVTEPILVFGTAFAWVQLLDSTDETWQLPEGSIVIETGGFKGRTREVPREELYAQFSDRLGVPLDHCWSEYGMSEMASQFYGHGLDPVKRAPHWIRTRTIDPVTGEDAASGEPGLLRHYDLANFNSVMALQTQDMGVLTYDGFVLLGRAADAPVRGCSLTVEELWNQ